MLAGSDIFNWTYVFSNLFLTHQEVAKTYTPIVETISADVICRELGSIGWRNTVEELVTFVSWGKRNKWVVDKSDDSPVYLAISIKFKKINFDKFILVVLSCSELLHWTPVEFKYDLMTEIKHFSYYYS